MGDLAVSSDLTIHYEDDDFADPWSPHETFLLLHGFAESSAAWFAWVPHLARRHRVLRPDLRGFGASTVPRDARRHPWSVTEFAADVLALLDALEVPRVHVVGARVGCPVGIALCAEHPERVSSLSLISGLARGSDVRGLRDRGGEAGGHADEALVGLDCFAERIRADGLAAWFSATGRARLGTSASDPQVGFWNALMARSDEDVCIAMMHAAAKLDVTELLARVRAPTLVVASQASRVQTIEATRGWQRMIPGSDLVVLSGDSPHLAATDPDTCAGHVLEFVRRCAVAA